MEEWRDIPGYEGRYQASTEGRIRSLDRIVTCEYRRTGNVFEKKVKGKLKRPTLASNGYYVVNLGHADLHCVHELVALAFNPGPGNEVRHLDGNPLNNKAENLAFGTHSDNERDKLRYGGKRKKLTASDVIQIRTLRHAGVPRKEVADRFGITETAVWQTETGRMFSWLE